MAVFLALFVILALVSAASNVSLLLLIVKQKLYKESLTLCLANMLVVHTVEVCVVLPLCVCTRLVQNWVLGQTVCYILPVITVITNYQITLIESNTVVLTAGLALSALHADPPDGESDQVREAPVPQPLPAPGRPAAAAVLAGVAGGGPALPPPHPVQGPPPPRAPHHGRPALSTRGGRLRPGSAGERNISTAVSIIKLLLYY